MKIICSSSVAYAREAFETLGDVVVLRDRGMTAADVRDAEVLIVRSTTKITPELLDGSRIRFVGTATIGTDHMNLPYLERRGIRWCYAPGCNANSVSEYVTSALLSLAVRHRFCLAGKTIGVGGGGNVGSKVVLKARALGLRVLQNDPPRQRIEQPEGPSAAGPFHSLAQVLAESDIVTLHVPLTYDGPDQTYHLADERFFRNMKRGGIFLNAARGPVVQTESLLGALADGAVGHAVLDTWEPEPAYPGELLNRVDLGTPHIAGYSFEGKVQGTYMIYAEACRFLGCAPLWSPGPVLESLGGAELRFTPKSGSGEQALWDIAKQVYNIESDDLNMRQGNAADAEARASHFDALRREYPIRREFPSARVIGCPESSPLGNVICALGFHVRSA
jgi:erythronate-4-phosphate dehydrogenase